MTKPYLKSKTLTVGENILTKIRLELAATGEAFIDVWAVSGETGVNYISCNSAVHHVLNVLKSEGLRVIAKRGEGYTVTYSFCCKVCGKYIKSESLLNEHEQTHYKEPTKPHINEKCPKCSRQFADKKSLISHLEKGCSGLEVAEPSKKAVKTKKENKTKVTQEKPEGEDEGEEISAVLSAYQNAELHTSLDAPSNISDRGSMKPCGGK